MKEIVNILLLEDLKTDTELIQRAVRKVAPDAIFTVANSKETFEERLSWGTFDIVLADYHLPAYNGLEALIHVRTHFKDLPFVFVTGSLNNEEEVAQAILNGADGYILKQNMQSLGTNLVKVLERLGQQDKLRLEKVEKNRLRLIQLQKVAALLEQAPDFSGKHEAVSILQALVEEPVI